MENNADKILRRDNEAAQTMLARSAKFKANTVAADQRETGGQRALLNLGHTFAHGLETAAGYGEWLHGEAVAAGLVAAARLSEELLQFSAADTSRIVALLKKLQLPFSFRGMDSEKVFFGDGDGQKIHRRRPAPLFYCMQSAAPNCAKSATCGR